MKTTASPLQVITKLLLRWWWLVAISVALGAGVGWFVRSRQPEIYFTRASLWFGTDITALAQSGGSLNQLDDLIAIYSAFIRRDTVLQPVIDRLGLNMTVADLNDRLAINDASDLPILEIVVGDTDPIRGAEISNAIASEIVEEGPANASSPENEFKRQQLRELQQQIEGLTDQYNQLVAEQASLTSAVEISANLGQQQSILATKQELQSLYAELSSGLAGAGGQVRILEFATADNAPSVGGSFLSVVLAAGGGLVVALATIVLFAFLDDRMEWHEGLENVMGVRVLGPLGIVPRNKLPLYVITMPDAIEAEVLRQLRAKIVLAAGGQQPRMITVTSYDSGDGKTVTATNLALAWSQAGLRTVLVDGDIRKGNLHEHFHLPNLMGISDILSGRDSVEILLSRALLESGYENLTVLPSGRSTADPAALLSGTRFAPLVTALRAQFDLVIMDSVPTIGGPDAAFMAEESDGVIIVVHAQRTTEKAFKRTLKSLEQARRLTIYGVVYNRIPLQSTSVYNRPYYRRTLAISPDKLNAEVLGTSSRGRLPFLRRRNIIVQRDGQRLYSLEASAVHLGVNIKTLREWIKSGYLKSERRGRRQWVRESVMQEMIERLPRHELSPTIVAADGSKSEEESRKRKITSAKIPDLLRGQRDALLASVQPGEAEEPTQE